MKELTVISFALIGLTTAAASLQATQRCPVVQNKQGRSYVSWPPRRLATMVGGKPYCGPAVVCYQSVAEGWGYWYSDDGMTGPPPELGLTVVYDKSGNYYGPGPGNGYSTCTDAALAVPCTPAGWKSPANPPDPWWPGPWSCGVHLPPGTPVPAPVPAPAPAPAPIPTGTGPLDAAPAAPLGRLGAPIVEANAWVQDSYLAWGDAKPIGAECASPNVYYTGGSGQLLNGQGGDKAAHDAAFAACNSDLCIQLDKYTQPCR